MDEGKTRLTAESLANNEAFYTGDSFWVPERGALAVHQGPLPRRKGVGQTCSTRPSTALEHDNVALDGVVQHIDFTRKVGQRSVTDKSLQQLIDHFGRHRLRNEDFEFPDLLGAAYEYLIAEFADSAGKKGGEFYTPRAVVRMMIRLVDPKKGMRVYDPCCGSGGMLIYSQEYVEEHGGGRGDLSLYGQEYNGGTWAISKMNMVLHGINNADLQNDDTLATPRHVEPNGELTRFDRVLTNPPFSQNYDRRGHAAPSTIRLRLGPGDGQEGGPDVRPARPRGPGGRRPRRDRHAARRAVPRRQGTGDPQGDHRGGPPGGGDRPSPEPVLTPASRPASWCCAAPARAPPTAGARSCSSTPTASSPRAARRTTWTRSTSRRSSPPTTTTRTNPASPASSSSRNWPRTTSTSTSAATSTTRPRPNRRTSAPTCTAGCRRQRSPLSEARFAAYGIEVAELFDPAERPGYLAFPQSGWESVADEIPAMAAAKRSELSEAFDEWWDRHVKHIIELSGMGRGKVMDTRADLLDSFVSALKDLGMLDRYQLAGVIASWWGGVQ